VDWSGRSKKAYHADGDDGDRGATIPTGEHSEAAIGLALVVHHIKGTSDTVRTIRVTDAENAICDCKEPQRGKRLGTTAQPIRVRQRRSTPPDQDKKIERESRKRSRVICQ
jgi:hypothetical protein